MSHWWRAEDTSIDHPKLLKLSDAMFRAWYTLNCVASANDGVLPSTEDIAIRLRMKKAKVAEWITKLVSAGLYDNDEGEFRPHNWNKRQYKTDGDDPTNAERQKRYRDNRRNGRNGVTSNGSNGVTPKRPEAETETDSEQSRADASAPVDEDLKRKASALAAGISAHFLSRQQTIPNLDRCLLWLSQGYAAGTVLAAVETVLKRGKVITTLDYFDGAIKDRHAITVVAETATVAPIDWDKTVKRWKSNNSLWPRGVGGEPGMWGCKCPANVLADNQIDPATGRVMNGDWHFIEENTSEMAAFCHDAQVRNIKPPVIFEIEINGVAQRGSYQPRRWPRGYDEATGEKLAPSSDEAAA